MRQLLAALLVAVPTGTATAALRLYTSAVVDLVDRRRARRTATGTSPTAKAAPPPSKTTHQEELWT